MGKTKQASVRFDPDKLELVKRREKLQTPQKVVDFLMDAYWWQNKLIVAPQLNTLGQTLPYVAPVVPKTPLQVYQKEISEAASLDELGKTGQHFINDPQLTAEEKEKLNKLAENKAKDIII